MYTFLALLLLMSDWFGVLLSVAGVSEVGLLSLRSFVESFQHTREAVVDAWREKKKKKGCWGCVS